MKIIDLDAVCDMSLGQHAGLKFSSGYAPPELVAQVVRDGKVTYVIRKPNSLPLDYPLVAAHTSYDIWSLGILMYDVVASKSFFHCDLEDNIDVTQLQVLHDLPPEFLSAQLQAIPDLVARNLVSVLLNKDPKLRPSFSKILTHPFFTGKATLRMVGDPHVYDVYISYRDLFGNSREAQQLYDLLTAMGVKCFLDKLCLAPG